jgi:signal peptidase I
MHPTDELAAEVLRRGRPLRIKARGGSMMPFLWDGDVAFITPTADTEIGVGDVICYEAPPGRLFLHRVIERRQERFVAKGDALAFTEVIDPPQLLGKVIAIERHGRIRWLDTRAARWRNRAIVTLSPVLPRLLPLAIRMRRIWRASFQWLS